MSAPERVTREEAQAEIPGIVVAEIIMDFVNNFRDVYPTDLLARGVGPEQSMIGLAIKRGHLVRADLSAAREAAARRELIDAASQWAAETFEGDPIGIADWLRSQQPEATAALDRMLTEARREGWNAAQEAASAWVETVPDALPNRQEIAAAIRAMKDTDHE